MRAADFVHRILRGANPAARRRTATGGDSAVVISSTMPSAKYSCSGSPLMLANGSTAIDGLAPLLTQVIEQRPGLVQIGRVKALGEPAVDRRKDFASLNASALFK